MVFTSSHIKRLKGRKGREIPLHRQLGAAQTPQQERNTGAKGGFLSRETSKDILEAAEWYKIIAVHSSIASCMVYEEFLRYFSQFIALLCDTD